MLANCLPVVLCVMLLQMFSVIQQALEQLHLLYSSTQLCQGGNFSSVSIVIA